MCIFEIGLNCPLNTWYMLYQVRNQGALRWSKHMRIITYYHMINALIDKTLAIIVMVVI